MTGRLKHVTAPRGRSKYEVLRHIGPPSTLFFISNPENAAKTQRGTIEKTYDSQAHPLR